MFIEISRWPWTRMPDANQAKRAVLAIAAAGGAGRRRAGRLWPSGGGSAGDLPGARRRPLSGRVLFSLDEVANIAPLQELPQIASEGGGQGLTLLAACRTSRRRAPSGHVVARTCVGHEFALGLRLVGRDIERL